MWWVKLVQTIFTSGCIELEHIVSNCQVRFSENNLKQRNIGRTTDGNMQNELSLWYTDSGF
jgi:hypothetical protein